MKASLQKVAAHSRPRSSTRSNRPFFPGRPQLKTGKPGDKFEREADAMADRVVAGENASGRSPQISPVRGLDLERQPMDREEQEPAQLREDESNDVQLAEEETETEESPAQLQENEEVQAKVGDEKEREENTIAPDLAQKQEAESAPQEELQKFEDGPEEPEEPMQRQTDDEPEVQSQSDEEDIGQSKATAQPTVPSPKANVTEMIRRQRGQGSPLPENLRNKMEQRFSADFTGVRIHRDEVELTQALGAQAFTSGADIFFNRNRYNPATRAGEHLLAHELTHTIQQGATRAEIIPLGRSVAHLTQSTNEEQLQAQEDDDEDTESYFLRPELLQAIRLARSQIGKVDANTTNADGTRVGWEHLLEYFRTAFGGQDQVHPSVIKRKKLMLLPKHGTDEKEMRDAMPSWCGIFVWWAMKKSGVPIKDWKLGVSAFDQFKQRGVREIPQKGDIAHAKDHAHWAMVTGVESATKAAGKPYRNVMVRTLNGNTAGEDTRGGQIQELWHPISRWIGFFDPVAKLDMPPVDLVRTGREPDPDEGIPDVPEEKHEPPTSDVGNIKDVEGAKPEPPPEGKAAVAVELPPPVEQGSPEEIAEIPELDLSGSSDQATIEYTNSTPSQMAAGLPKLGEAVTGKMEAEKKDQADNPPVLTTKTSGKVEDGITPPSELAVPTDPKFSDKDTDNLNDLEPGEHKDHFNAPSTADTRKNIEKQPGESLFAWLKKNMLNLISGIRVSDKGVNTSAGPREKVRLEGKADPGRIAKQREDADTHLVGKRDEVSDKLSKHPGQTNIQAKAVEVENTVAVSAEPGEPVILEDNNDAADYASAPLPENVRTGADAEIGKTLGTNIMGARKETSAAALARDTNRDLEIENAKTETMKLNTDADEEQRRIVLDNRTKVAQQQEEGIKNAYGEMDRFRKESDEQQTTTNKDIREKTTTAENEAHGKLKNAEDTAKQRKKEAEKEAADKKKELERENKKKSWWDRGVDFVKSAVSLITKAIDGIFNALRKGIATLINEAKKLAIGLINKARNAIVGLLNGFRTWTKNKVNEYLKDRFPKLAAAINKRIDSTVDLAITGVNKAADTAIKGVEALAGALGKLLDKILSVFQTALKAAVEIAGAVVTGDLVGALKIAIKAACEIAGIDPKPIFDFMEKAGNQIKAILKAPKPFFNNLMKAVGTGVRNFRKNIKDYLIKGVIGWLTGALSEVAITLPEKFDAKGIFSLGMQILSLTYENIKARVIKRFPPAGKIFSAIEKGIAIIKKLREGGIAALWEEVKQVIGNFRKMVLDAIRGFVITTVMKEAAVWLLSLLNPAAAIVKVVKLLFDFVMFLIERFRQIKDFVLSIYNTITDVASGNFTKVAKGVEDAMARSLPVVISLLARLAGLGGIGKTVKKLIGKVSKPVNKVIDKVINRVIKFAKKLLKKGKKAAKKVAAKLAKWWKVRRKFKGTDGENHSLYFKGEGKSAVLAVRSKEQSYTQFLAWAIKQEDQDKTAVQAAKTIAKQLDQEKARKLKGKNDAEKEADSKKKKAKVEELIDKLQEKTKLLFSDSLPDSKVAWGSPTGADFGSSMKAEILTTRRTDSKLKGSTPTQAAHSVYDKLNMRRQRGGASYYIRGHLLNDNVDGPGKWFNMTPLSRQGNKSHESDAESTVKAGVNSGAIIEYNVIPKYTSRPNSDSIISKAGAGLSKMDKDVLKDIVNSENHVPTGLGIKIATKEEKNGKYEVVKSRSLTVLNPVERNPESYFLSGGAKKIQRIDVNNLTSSNKLKSPDITENLRSNAGPIWAAVKARQEDPGQAMFGTYGTLADDSGIPIASNDREYLVLRPRKKDTGNG